MISTNNPVRLGVVPVKRGRSFVEQGLECKRTIAARLAALTPPEVELIDVDDAVPDGIVCGTEGLDAAESKLRAAGVDALFMPHLDFGCEESVGRLASALRVPFLLWGPRDPSPDPQTGERRTDTQCGLFASGKALQWLEVPFDHIVNCRVTDPEFATGYECFVGAAAIVKAVRGLRIAQIGTRPAPFLSVMCNESELFRRFGIQIVPVPFPGLVKRVNELASEGSGAELDDVLAGMRSQVDCGPMDPEALQRLAALRIVLAKAILTNECRAAAIECWSALPEATGIVPCYVNGDLAGEGIPMACETDIMGAISGVLGQAASFDREPTFFADFTQRHPDNDNAELLWHCGPFPHRLRAPGEPASMKGCMGHWRLRDGTITLLRLDQLAGRYALSVGRCRTVDGPRTHGTYVWVEMEDWPRWEHRLIRGPGIHHVVGVYGDYVEPLLAACKYLEPGAPHGVQALNLDAAGD